MANGFCSEVVVFRKYLDLLIASISGEGFKELEIDASTVETFRTIETILKLISLSQLAIITESYKLTKSSLDTVIKKYTHLLNPYITPDDFLQRKGIDRVVKIAKEKEKNK